MYSNLILRSKQAVAYLCVNGLELLDPVVEGQDLGGADKGEVERIEEENQVFTQVITSHN